jgi:hypothetical protein
MAVRYVIFGILVGVLVIVVTIVLLVRRRKIDPKKEEVNYQMFFIMGISFLPLGIIFSVTINPGFMAFIAMGLIYMILGLAHRDEWEKPRKKGSG